MNICYILVLYANIQKCSVDQTRRYMTSYRVLQTFVINHNEYLWFRHIWPIKLRIVVPPVELITSFFFIIFPTIFQKLAVFFVPFISTVWIIFISFLHTFTLEEQEQNVYYTFGFISDILIVIFTTKRWNEVMDPWLIMYILYKKLCGAL